MKKREDIRKRILNQPSYWVESANGQLYDAILRYMESNKMKQADLADYLNITAGRVSQILNTGDINYSIEKYFEIALKVNTVPIIKFEPKSEYIENEFSRHHRNSHSETFEPGVMSVVPQDPNDGGTKVIPLNSKKELSIDYLKHGL